MNDADALARAMLGGGVGDVEVRPRFVGDPMVRPVYPGQGGVGLPVAMVQGAPQQQAVEYSPQVYVAGNVTWMGLGITSILAGAAGQEVQIVPLRPMTPQKIFCPSTVQGLLIGQAQIGGTNIFANNAGVPIELFSEVSTAPQIDWPTLDTSNGITFTLINPTAGALNFTGALYGTAVRR